MTSPQSPLPSYRSGYIAIAGRPNTGKSTLLNTLMGMHLSIIAPRPQTTRRNVLGILTTAAWQAVLVDTPGLLDPSYRLHAAMQAHARAAIAGADVLLVLLDAIAAVERDPEPLLQPALAAAGPQTPVVVGINKIDRVLKEKLLPLMAAIEERWHPEVLVPVSALKGDGVAALLDEVVERLPVGPALYPEDMITDQPERFFVAEFVREAAFRHLRQEVPYATVAQTEEFRRGGSKTYINVVIYVERENQRAILIGKGGRTIRRIGQEARETIEEFLGEPTYLDLHVKVRPDWRHRDASLRDLGLL